MSDADLSYQQSRNTQPSLLEQARLDVATPKEPEVVEEDPRPFTQRFLPDVVAGAPGVETAVGFVSGAVEGVKQVSRSIESGLDKLDIPSVVQLTNEKGEFELDLLTREEAGEEGTIFPKFERPESFVPALASGVGQFLVAFAPAFKALKGLGTGTKAVAAGAVADAFAFDPFEERLSNIAQDLGINNFVTEFLATSPDDTEAEGRFKNAIEGGILGKIGESLTTQFFKAVRTFREAKTLADEGLAAKADQAVVEAEVQADIDALQRIDDKVGAGETEVISLGNDRVFRGGDSPIDPSEVGGEGVSVTRNKKTAELFTDPDNPVIGESTLLPNARILTDEDIPKVLLDDYISSAKELADLSLSESDSAFRALQKTVREKQQNIIDHARGKDFDAVEFRFEDEIRVIKPGVLVDDVSSVDFKGIEVDEVPEKAVNVNLARLETPDDIKNIINKVGESFEGDIQAARREKITLEQTEKLADDMGLTVEQLLTRRKGEAFNAEQAVAARKIMVSSATKLKELAKVANSSAGSKEDQVAFLRGLSIHKAIQEQVSGLTAEAGRALSSFRIRAGEVDLALNNIPVEDMAKAIADQDTLSGINSAANGMDKATTSEQLLEVWINGLLSNPVTHSVNVTSNAIVNFWAIPDRLLASGIGKVLGGQEIATGEVVSMLRGLKEGYKDGLTLGWKALKTGEVEDPLTKLDVKRHRAIPGEALDLTGIGGRAADFLQEAVKNPLKGLFSTAKLPLRFGGEVVRLPGRALTAGDALFKAVNYRMELNALAFRQAKLEGLEGRAMATRITEILNDPPQDIVKEATRFSRVQTFTNELGTTGRAVQAVSNSHPATKVLLPFVRTPTNIVKMVGSKSPLAPFAQSVREDIFAGGARRDLALAKMASGSMIMTVAASMASEGRISGGGSANKNIMKLQRDSGWQPYSVNIGGPGKDATWIAYNRLDPIGMTIGLAADYAEISGNIDEFDLLNVSSAIVMSTAKNLSSKTYMRGLSEFLGAIDQSTTDPDKDNAATARYISRLAGSIVPAGVAQVTRILDPTLKDTDGIIQTIKSRIPGYGEDLPSRLNMWGEEIILDGGLGPDIISPLYISHGEEAPISDEMVRLQLPIGMPSRSIKGVKLTPQEYHDFIKLTAETGVKGELERVIELPEYQELTDGPEGAKATVIRSFINRTRTVTRETMLGGDDPRFQQLRQRIREKEAESVEALGG